MIRIGHGFDVHALVKQRKLILAGVEIAHHHGLLGHSDADVVIHALGDALLGAVALGDLGSHFPATEHCPVNSRLLLQHIRHLIAQRGYQLHNADVTVIAQEPTLASYITQMQTNLAADLMTTRDTISVKATTTDYLGTIGRKEGIAAHAVVTVVTLDKARSAYDRD